MFSNAIHSCALHTGYAVCNVVTEETRITVIYPSSSSNVWKRIVINNTYMDREYKSYNSILK